MHWNGEFDDLPSLNPFKPDMATLLSDHSEPGFCKSFYHVPSRDNWKLFAQALDCHFNYLLALTRLDFGFVGLQVQLDCFRNVSDGFLLAVSLAYASGKRRRIDRITTFFLRFENDFDLHESVFGYPYF